MRPRALRNDPLKKRQIQSRLHNKRYSKRDRIKACRELRREETSQIPTGETSMIIYLLPQKGTPFPISSYGANLPKGIGFFDFV